MVTKQLNKHQTDVKEILLIFSIARRKIKVSAGCPFCNYISNTLPRLKIINIIHNNTLPIPATGNLSRIIARTDRRETKNGRAGSNAKK